LHHKLKNKNIMKNIVNYNKCQCGAIELIFEDGTINHILKKNLKKFGISLKGVKRLIPTDYVHCDHCVNHYGIDLCSCGSGLTPDKCCKKDITEDFYDTAPALIKKRCNMADWRSLTEYQKASEEFIIKNTKKK